MPGYELLGREELAQIHKVFDSGAVLLRHGFEKRRGGLYMTRDFEESIAERAGSKYCVAVSSATVALKIALLAVGVEPGDEVILPAFTFVATAEAVLDCGAIPIFANIDESLTMAPGDLASLIIERTRAVIPVHMLGQAADLTAISSAADAAGIAVVEDAAQAFGATHADRPVGPQGTIGVYSFDYNKTLTTGEGGAIVTNDPALYRFCVQYHDHGHVNDPNLPRGQDRWGGFGFNYRLSEVSAAIGVAQLSKLEHILAANNDHWLELDHVVGGVHVAPDRRESSVSRSIRDCYVLTCETEERAQALTSALADIGVQTKNVPSALKWHFAANWEHLLEPAGYEIARVRRDLRPSADLLLRRVAIPVNVNDSSSTLAGIAEVINRHGGSALGADSRSI